MNRAPLLRRTWVVSLLTLLSTASIPAAFRSDARAADAPAAAPLRKLNVLFIAVDDLRPALGCAGDPLAKTPNIDRLAAGGTVFTRAYCQQAVCSPSRNSLLTGLRPDTIGIYDLATHFRTAVPDAVTLPQHFKQHGYHAEGMGKIYHTGHGNYDDVHSWSVPSWPAGARGPIPGEKRTDAGAGRTTTVLLAPADAPARAQPRGRPATRPATAPTTQPRGPAYRAPNVADDALFDGKLANHAVGRLQELARNKDQPFFLAVGFHKPHLPFVAPKRYWDLYDPAALKLDGPDRLPAGALPYAGNGSGELRQYDGIPKQGPIPEDLGRRLVHGYYASVSYMDAQVGRVLDELDRLGLAGNTVVVLWGDHGWHLGNHGLWAKHTNYERATRAPLIVRAPGRKSVGVRCEALVEFVDIYPTLTELCGLPPRAGLEGTSFTPLLDDPKRPWKSAAFSLYPRSIRGQGQGMGRTVRTDRYRLTEWTVPGKEFSAVELYDYQADPDESANLADKPEHAARVAELKALLKKDGWKAAVLPNG